MATHQTADATVLGKAFRSSAAQGFWRYLARQPLARRVRSIASASQSRRHGSIRLAQTLKHSVALRRITASGLYQVCDIGPTAVPQFHLAIAHHHLTPHRSGYALIDMWSGLPSQFRARPSAVRSDEVPHIMASSTLRRFRSTELLLRVRDRPSRGLVPRRWRGPQRQGVLRHSL